MDAFTAIGILDGFVECEGAEHFLSACQFIARTPCAQGIAAGIGTQIALGWARYAKLHGEDHAIEAIEEGVL